MKNESKAFEVLASVRFGELLLPVLLITGLLGSGRLAPGGQGSEGAIRGEPIGGARQTNSVSSTNAAALKVAAAAEAKPANAGSVAAGSVKQDGFLVAGFDKLAGYNLETGNDAPLYEEKAAAASRKVMDQIPASVKALNQKQVAVRGFMMPMKVEKGMVTEFLLLRNQMGCCYGMSPGLNEWIEVKASGKGIKPQMDDLITVCGTLHLGAIRENGYLTGLYRMDCEKIQPAQ
jgi:hypothetical protein